MENNTKSTTDSGFEMHKEQFARLAGMSECGMMIAKMQAEPEIMYANDGFYKMFQYTPEEFRKCFENRVMGPALPEEKQRMKALMARQVSMGGSIHLEFRAKRKDDSIIWISFRAKREAKPGSMIYYCSCLDISGSKRHLQDVYNAKRELDLIANSIPGGVIKVRLNDFKIMYANDGFFRLAGYSRSEYSMQFHNDTSELVYPEDMDMVSRVIRQAIENRGPLAMEYRIMAKSGEIRWSYINGTRIDDDNGQPVYLCVIVDITARKQAEAELADNNHRSNVITKMLRETIWTYDLDAHVLHRDGDLGGTYSPETILEGQFTDENIRAIIHPDDVEKFIQMRNSWDADAGMHQDIFRVINGNGAYQRVQISTSTEKKKDGEGSVVYGLTRLLLDNEQNAVKAEQVKNSELEITQLAGKLKKIAASARAKTEDTITGLLPYAPF
ncbi:PAS domain S-box protein [Clostridium sp. OM07-10AC]|nr:PAS domain S-box protein [Clostridium sp. OM07-9AC]RHV00622.1 PAS domain S-box protein [Clostridium sp. OM07-10AC]